MDKRKARTKIKGLKILSFDIETMPIIGYAFGFWETDILKTVQDSYMLCYSYKWLGEKETHVVALPDFKGYKKNPRNDKELTKSLHALFCEADIIIAHNGDSFDIKKSNVRFAYHKLSPPSPYRTIDTKLVAKRYFKFDSNKLTELGRFLGLGVKEETGGIQLWFDCEAGVKKAWAKMKSYNKQDVILLEKVYLELRPWIKNHPNLAIIMGEKRACVNCGSANIHKKGLVYTNTGLQQSWKCNDCGARRTSALKDGSQIK